MQLNVKMISHLAKYPTRAHETDAGLDIYADIMVRLEPHCTSLVSTGICVEVPTGHVGLIQEKSSLAAKESLVIGGGVIDSSYRGEIKLVLHNFTDKIVVIPYNKAIAQLVIYPIALPTVLIVDELSETERNTGGFGSTNA